MEKYLLFNKPKEVVTIAVENIKAAYLGHIVFPISYAFLSEILINHRMEYFWYLGFFITNSTIHFALGFFYPKTRVLLGDKGWSMAYLMTLTLEALSFIPPVFYAVSEYGFWSPQTLYSLLVWVIGLEGFAKYCYAYFESFLLATISLILPIIIGLPFYGFHGTMISIFAFFYYLVVFQSAWSAFKQSKELFKEKSEHLESKERLQDLLDILPSKVLVVDQDYEFRSANKRFLDGLKISDLGKDENHGQHNAYLKWKDSLGRGFKEIVSLFFSLGKSETSFDYQVDFGEGKRWHHLALKKSYLEGKDNKPNLIIIAIDIHDKKISEHELEQQRLININSSKLASLGEMAGGIAHEINNPLAIILGNTNYLLKNIDKGKLSNESLKEKLEKIESVGFRMQKIIKGMKNLIRSDSATEEEPFSIFQLIDDSLGLCLERFKSSGIEIKIPFIDENLIAIGNYQQVGQIIVNLLNNAHDILESYEKKLIEVKVEIQDENIIIQIMDSGPGVDNEDKLFQPFYTTKPIGKGTGLGLSLSKKIANKNGGDLTYSRSGDMTVFQLSILKYNGKSKSAA